MANCHIRGEALPPGTRTCGVRGTRVPDLRLSNARAAAAPAGARFPSAPANRPAGGRFCPACGQVYSADYGDAFCICGTELVEGGATVAATTPALPPPVFGDADLSLTPAGTAEDGVGFTFD